MTGEEIPWFDPADLRCQTPYRAVPTGTSVGFGPRPPRREGFVRGELLVQWEFQDARVTEHDMPWTGLDGARDLFSCRLEVGDQVEAGDLIGYLGMTGYSVKENVNGMTKPHLHFGLQIIFDESQKDGTNQIWVDVYHLVELLEGHRSYERE